MIIDTIEQAEDFVKNLKRSENWVSNDELYYSLEQAELLIKQYQREDLLPYLGINFCLYHFDHGNIEKCIHYADTATINAEKYNNYDCLLSGISLQYRIQRQLGNLEKAQEIVNKQIDIALKYKDPHQIASAYNNQAMIFHRQRLKTDCYEAYEKSLEYINQSRIEYYISNFYIGYASIMLDFDDFEKAEPVLNKGFLIAKQHNFLQNMAIAYSNYGMLYEATHNEKKSISSFKESIRLFRKIENIANEIMAKIMLADAYVSFNRIHEAEKILKNAISFSEKNKLKYNLLGVYSALTKIAEKKEDYKESLFYLKKLMQLKEEHLNTESEKRIQNLETVQKLNILRIEKQNAEQMASIKHDFLANMSHEIRTPINSILGICYLLDQQSLNEIQSNYVQRLKRSGENLLGIINDVLDISKIESGKMDLVSAPFSLNTLLNDIYNSLEPKALEKPLHFSIFKKYKNDIELIGDAVRTYQVLLNFASNAIKFTSNGAVKITVGIKESAQDKIILEFKIQDTGIGIAKNKIETIFERYEQADASIKTKFGGTGLGLSISKKIIELMNGSIQVSSKLNKGTCFTLSIPYLLSKKESGLVTASESADATLLNNKLILIADDNEENRLVAKEILQSYNATIKIMEAADGNEVINLLFKKIPDIIFMDLDMPNLNGLETTQLIRKNKKYDKIKIIGNTASLSTFTDEELKELGLDGFIQKPYKPQELIIWLFK